MMYVQGFLLLLSVRRCLVLDLRCLTDDRGRSYGIAVAEDTHRRAHVAPVQL